MRDVTALVLSVGEFETDRAIASVHRQTLPPAEAIVVTGVSPFHRALAEGASRVRTPFFVQVDADMILDDSCVEDLRGCIADRVGMVVGHLRDPLLGRIVGIKLFRRECFDRIRLRDTVSPETDFVRDMLGERWTMQYALKHTGPIGGSPGVRDVRDFHTFGEHRPDYGPHYTFCKFQLEGAKARYRKAGGGLRGMFRRLHASTHPAAIVAVIGAAHGIFMKGERDLQAPFGENAEIELLQRFLNAPEGSERQPPDARNLVQDDLRAGFERAYELGVRLRCEHAPATFIGCLQDLSSRVGVRPWAALVGLCHGVFAEEYREADAAAAFTVLRDLLPADPSATAR
jgi:hypothetical protein